MPLPPSASASDTIKTPARLRLEKELADMDLPECIRLARVSLDAMEVSLSLFPDEGPFQGAKIDFNLRIPPAYPHSPPKAQILHNIFHPNFDYEGHVCLNILRLDWNPVLGLTAIFFGLISVLTAPDGEEPLNQDAGRMIETDPARYFQVARSRAHGAESEGIKFDNLF